MLYTAFILGLLGSFHCIGMCGPIAFVLPLDRSSKSKMIFQTFLYHFGRLLTYSLIGLLFGSIGKGLYLAGSMRDGVGLADRVKQAKDIANLISE